MDPRQPLTLLGGLSPQTFMRRHWQRRPLLIRQAWPGGIGAPIDRTTLFALAGRDDVESRLLTRFDQRWRLRHGPFTRRQLPAVAKPGWTLLVQGVDLHLDALGALRQAFRFVADARFDDVMLSYASDGGGVGPHQDSYDVFLLQAQGRRRWRTGKVTNRALVPGLPVRILADFEPSDEWLLEPGDMLYLPPGWGHDGIAEGGDCITCSVGFRAETQTRLAQALLQQLADDIELPEAGDRETIYRDPGQPALAPAQLPAALLDFARDALQRVLTDADALPRALGALLTEPKPQVWFEPLDQDLPANCGVALDRRSRMLYDARHVFLNGESFVAGGRDANLMRQLADDGVLSGAEAARLSAQARDLVEDWLRCGWLRPIVGG